MKNVLLIDSGSGGINILKECVKVVPSCNYLMFCDNFNLPYGNKTKEELQELTLNNLREIHKFFRYDIVILACNTLTCTCIEECRKIFPDVIFIGTVPAIKPAIQSFSGDEILVLATDVTLKHNILINKTPNLVLKSMQNLASEIDIYLDELQVLKEELIEDLKMMELKNIKAVVLGCTHYLAVKDILQDIFRENLSKEVTFFDSANGVARRLKHFVGDDVNCFQVQMMTTKNDENLLPKFWWYFNK